MARGPKQIIELCDLTDWRIPDNEGTRGRKSSTRQKWAVTVDNRNWTLVLAREGALSVGERFAGNLASLACSFNIKVKQSPIACLEIINNALAKIVGRKLEIDRSKTVHEIGAEMDRFYGTNLTAGNLDPQIAKLVGMAEDDE